MNNLGMVPRVSRPLNNHEGYILFTCFLKRKKKKKKKSNKIPNNKPVKVLVGILFDFSLIFHFVF